MSNEIDGIPVVEETVTLEKRRVATGRVRVRTEVHQSEQVVDEPLLYEEVDVERRAVDRWVEGPVAVRQEGDTIILPVLEEVLVVEKRLKLVGEVRISKRQVMRNAPQTVSLRRNDVIVEQARADEGGDPD